MINPFCRHHDGLQFQLQPSGSSSESLIKCHKRSCITPAQSVQGPTTAHVATTVSHQPIPPTASTVLSRTGGSTPPSTSNSRTRQTNPRLSIPVKTVHEAFPDGAPVSILQQPCILCCETYINCCDEVLQENDYQSSQTVGEVIGIRWPFA